MSVLTAVLDAARSGAVEIVDLTTALQSSTPILELPPPLANTSRFRLEELSRYDDRGPAWYWTTSTPASTPAPTSTRPCTGCRARTGSKSRRPR